MNKNKTHPPVLHHFRDKENPFCDDKRAQLVVAIESINDETRQKLVAEGKVVKVIPQNADTPLVLQMLQNLIDKPSKISLSIDDVVNVVGAAQMRVIAIEAENSAALVSQLAARLCNQKDISNQAFYVLGSASLNLEDINRVINIASSAASEDAGICFGYGIEDEKEDGIRFLMVYPASDPDA